MSSIFHGHFWISGTKLQAFVCWRWRIQGESFFSSFTPLISHPYYSRSFMNSTFPYRAATCIEVSELSEAAYRELPPYSNLHQWNSTITEEAQKVGHVSSIQVNSRLPIHRQALMYLARLHFPKNNAPHSNFWDEGQWQKHPQFPFSWTAGRNSAYRINFLILSTLIYVYHIIFFREGLDLLAHLSHF